MHEPPAPLQRDPAECFDAVAAAARGIQQAMADWDAVNDSFSDENGTVVDTDGWNTRIVKRDLAAWQNFTAVLRYGGAFLFHTRRFARPDAKDAGLAHDWRELARSFLSAYESVSDTTEFAEGLGRPRLEELAAEVWHEMVIWADHAPALLAACGHPGTARAASTGPLSAAKASTTTKLPRPGRLPNPGSAAQTETAPAPAAAAVADPGRAAARTQSSGRAR
ncbi:hypothetical protein ACFC26_14800 [Kitasatospora purpeofusca]|uniref:hypothetical protein n=1 Tax=Kitasatospora purpeofusca TaxID=67352 RepID=UPI0035D9B9A7